MCVCVCALCALCVRVYMRVYVCIMYGWEACVCVRAILGPGVLECMCVFACMCMRACACVPFYGGCVHKCR